MSDLVPATAELGEQVVRLTRQMGALKAHASSKHRHGVEWSSYVLLFHLVKHGQPMRASLLAEVVCADPSTISRQTASLVENGLVERRPDPDDGRAAQLVATTKGRELYAQVRTNRDELFAGVLADWQADDVRQLATLLDRFTTDLERHRPHLLKQIETQETA
ncbi:MarR family winged helix-turn-helix transcriptional regulator [Angustibacter sp. McL0619]|uniref:MarR family winged helix-turn-helix transcriptional regulator n=1 Tax=Angustibacter sp. McL0619 TaxID=3415676 RepID=UPI003CEA1A06